MGNLAPTNIYRDDGYISKDVIFSLEKYYKITLPAIYVDFIISHNGARLNADVFDYFDYNPCCYSCCILYSVGRNVYARKCIYSCGSDGSVFYGI